MPLPHTHWQQALGERPAPGHPGAQGLVQGTGKSDQVRTRASPLVLSIVTLSHSLWAPIVICEGDFSFSLK